MKKLFTTACIAAWLTICPAKAQSQDALLVRNDKEEVKKTNEDRDRIEKEGLKINTSETNHPGKPADKIEPVNVRTEFYKSEKRSPLAGKVGPNGEELFLKGSKYYYINSEGKKVKVKSSRLKDSPKHS